MNTVSTVKPSNGNKILEQKYIERILNQEARNIFQAQAQVLNQRNPQSKNAILGGRSFSVTNTTLVINHLMLQRFIDMRFIKGEKRKAIPNHNKIIYQHFNALVSQLKFGYTDDVKAQLAAEHKIQL